MYRRNREPLLPLVEGTRLVRSGGVRGVYHKSSEPLLPLVEGKVTFEKRGSEGRVASGFTCTAGVVNRGCRRLLACIEHTAIISHGTSNPCVWVENTSA